MGSEVRQSLSPLLRFRVFQDRVLSETPGLELSVFSHFDSPSIGVRVFLPAHLRTADAPPSPVWIGVRRTLMRPPETYLCERQDMSSHYGRTRTTGNTSSG